MLGAKLAHALGYRRPSKQRGIRILALDGGGSRGVVTVQLLKQLQQVAFSGKEPSDVFDLVVVVHRDEVAYLDVLGAGTLAHGDDGEARFANTRSATKRALFVLLFYRRR